MSPEKIEELRTHRSRLAEQLEARLATPEDQLPTDAKGRKRWAADLQAMSELYQQVDRALKALEKAGRLGAPAAEPQPQAEPKPAGDLGLVLARIHKGRTGAEVVVQISEWKGRRTIDIRIFSLRDGELRPTRRGVQMDVRAVGPLLEALRHAAQHA